MLSNTTKMKSPKVNQEGQRLHWVYLVAKIGKLPNLVCCNRYLIPIPHIMVVDCTLKVNVGH